jgi:hypothetical protein
MTTPFWSNDPTILFNKDSITQLWPTPQMPFEIKLNSISRLVCLLTILGFLFTKNWNIIIIGILTLVSIFLIYKFRKQKIVSSLLQKEGFIMNSLSPTSEPIQAKTTNPITLDSALRSDFYPTTKKNPFGNVLLTDIMDNPDRKAAAPSFNPDVHDDINSMVKKQTQMLNPDIKNTNKQIYGDLKDNYDLDMSMMQFYTTANSRVTNDQGAYAEYLYGNMYSGKDSGPEGALMRIKDNPRYLLI